MQNPILLIPLGIFAGRDVTVSAVNSVFDSNGGVMETGKTEGGGAIAAIDAIVNVDNCAFFDNTAVDGGAVYVDRGGQLTVNATQFKANSADLTGGAVVAHMKSKVNFMGSSTFEANTAASGGAIAATDTSTISIVASTFRSNHASSQGGAASISDSASFNVSDVIFEQNVGEYGGAVNIQGTREASFSRSRFLRNSASVRGGAFFCQALDKVDMLELSLTSNSAKSGGCIFWHSIDDLAPVYPCKDCVMTNNSLYDISTNTRNVEVMWWPTNVSSGLVILQPSDEESFSSIPSTEKSVAETMLVWPRLQAIDLYGQIEVLDFETTCSASSHSSNGSDYINFKPRDTIEAAAGVVSFEGATFSGDPRDEDYQLQMSCLVPEQGALSFIQGVKMLPCPPGYSTDNKYGTNCLSDMQLA
jgi:predicted outer membrane repeat protein